MPSMANITVKNAANADVVYVAATPSSGDRVPARWNFNAASAVAGFRPTFTALTRDNGNSNARVLETNFAFPHTVLVSGVESVTARTTMKMSTTLPTNVPTTAVEDAFWQAVGLLHSTLMREVAQTGYSPT